MIDRKQLEELREDGYGCEDMGRLWPELLDTLDALWKVAEAAFIFKVCQTRGCPKEPCYCEDDLENALAALNTGKDGGSK